MKSAVVAVVLLVCLVGASAVPTHLFPKANSVRVPDMHDKRVFWELPLAREQVVTENLAETLRIASEDAPDNDLSDKYSFLETAMGLTSRTQVGKVMGACKDCIFFLERVKKGINDWLPSICSELYAMHGSDEESADYDFSKCEQVLSSVQLNGSNLKYWFMEGCYKYEKYQAKEWVHPCPSHVICATLKNLSAAPFCKPLPMEDPFGESSKPAGKGKR